MNALELPLFRSTLPSVAAGRLAELLDVLNAYSVADLEDDLQDDRKNHYGVRDGIPNMRRFLDNARAQMEMPLNDELDLVSSPCGVFCHR